MARRAPWYQREPYPAVVGLLLNHELLTEGGTDSLRLAARVVSGVVVERPSEKVDEVTARLAREQAQGHLAHGPVDQAAQDVVDLLVERLAWSGTT